MSLGKKKERQRENNRTNKHEWSGRKGDPESMAIEVKSIDIFKKGESTCVKYSQEVEEDKELKEAPGL